jgi:hypothetical protein
MKYQRGVGMGELMLGAVALGCSVLLVLKVVPEWMEYSKIVKAVKSTASDTGLKESTVAQVRAAYQKKAEIDDIKSVPADDLDITKDGAELVISFAYQKKIPLFSNVSLVFDFEGSSAKQ